MDSKIEKYILLKGMHLGFIKDTFGRGAVIEYNPAKQAVRIDGRICENGSKDVEILKRQAMKYPEKAWICMYSDEALADIRGDFNEAQPVVPQYSDNKHKMEVIQSDEDSHQTIDISHTQISKIKNAQKEAERARKSSGDMPIIQGQQTVEDRIAELGNKKSTDLSARAEKVRLMGNKKADMPIIKDDSLGAGVGSGSSSSMNAGMSHSGRRSDEVPEYVSNSANSRKAEVANNRKKTAQDDFGFDPDQAGIDEIGVSPDDFAEPVESTLDVEIEEAPIPDAKDEEIARLKAQLAAQSQSELETPRRPTVKRTPVAKEQ